MAQSMGVGKQGVSKRLERLLSSGAILITTFVDPVALGFPLFCNVGVRVRPGAAQTVGSELATMEHVSYVAHSSGTFDLLVEAFLPDTEAVFDFLNQKLPEMDGIVDTKAWFVLRSAKYAYLWEESSVSMDPQLVTRTDRIMRRTRGLPRPPPRMSASQQCGVGPPSLGLRSGWSASMIWTEKSYVSCGRTVAARTPTSPNVSTSPR